MNPRLLPDLLIFLEVARSGSISKAARRLHTVQTNVSARMQKLEAALGNKLLMRTARGVDLTTAGEALLPVARRLDSLLGDLGQVFPNSRVRLPELLRVGSLETFAATHMASLIASYHAINPHPEFAITNGSSRSLVHMLQENELDVAFVSHPASAETLRTELTIKEELVLLAPTNRASSFDPKHAMSNAELPLIVQRQACSYSERFLSYLDEHHLPIPRTIEAGSIEALLGFVEQGLGIAVAPRSLINSSARRIGIVPLKLLRDQRWVSIHLISNQTGWNSTLRRFVEHCRDRFADGPRPKDNSGKDKAEARTRVNPRSRSH
jgi:DNA-binding transcriptional LysR family regulator